MKKVLRALEWMIAVLIALPLLPLAMSLCAGIYLVAAASDKGVREHGLSLAGGLLSLLVSAIGIFLIYVLVRLFTGGI